MNLDTADGVGPVSGAGDAGPNGSGAQAHPDPTPPTGDALGRHSGVVPDANVREAFRPVVADRAAPWDRMHIRSVTSQGVITVSTLDELELVALEVRCEARRLPAPGPRRDADRAVVEGWADLLEPMFATGNCCNLTGTYSDVYGYAHGLMLARNVIKDFRAFCRSLGRSQEAACVGVERHPSGRDVLHFHAIIGGSWTADDLQGAASLWVTSRGWAVAKSITDRNGCIEYAAKHLLKQRAEDHFEFWTPPRTFGSRVERRAYEHGMTLDEWHARNTDSAR